MKAHHILNEASKQMINRAKDRDKPEGERSMARTVAAFNALTGHKMSERDGWLFMGVLKMARATTTSTGRLDDYVDMAAYASLAGELAPEETKVTMETIPISEFKVNPYTTKKEELFGVSRETKDKFDEEYSHLYGKSK